MTFSSREQAGIELGRLLAGKEARPDVIVGLPRGGVIVAGEVARLLQRPLGVILVRKIGHPQYREFAVGALAEENVVLLDRYAIDRTNASSSDLDEVIAEERQRLEAYQAKFNQYLLRDLSEKTVAIVDDGLATGATTEAAVLSARKKQARRVTVAVPVASTNAAERLRGVADEVIAVLEDPAFEAVGRYYEDFPQTSDEEVIALLRKCAG